jgi:hypothetical protein
MKRPEPRILIVVVLLAAMFGFATPLVVADPAADEDATDSEPPLEATPADGAPTLELRRGDLVSYYGGDLHLPAHVRQHGSIVWIGGQARIEGEVTGDVVVILGELDLNGRVRGGVTGVLSHLRLSEAHVGGDLVAVLGSLQIANTSIDRSTVNVLSGFQRDIHSRLGEVINLGLSNGSTALRTLLTWVIVFARFAVFILLVLLVVIVPDRIGRMRDVAARRYAAAFAVGLLGYVGLLVIVGLLAITIIGLPLAWLAYWIAKWMGVAAIFAAIGRRMGRALGWEMSLLGAILGCFAIYVALSLLPIWLGLPGWLLALGLSTLFFLFVEVPGLGLVLLTSAGGARREKLTPAARAPDTGGGAMTPPIAPPAV